MNDNSLKKQVIELKQRKNALILAHYYQVADILEVADYVGDSLGLAKKAAESDSEIIVFAGVHFMAETAKIINPTRKVLLPDITAGCSLSESCPPDLFEEFLSYHPDHVVITYINSSARVKALSDVICTSSNALQIVESFPQDQKIIFAPDRNLGSYINAITGRNMVLWDGSCVVHEVFSKEKINRLRSRHPLAKVIAHPECEDQILDLADFIGSTAKMIQFIQDNDAVEFIIATEAGILESMKHVVPNKTLIPAPIFENNACACSECPYMKVNSLQKLYNCLLHEYPAIEIDSSLQEQALEPIERMLSYS